MKLTLKLFLVVCLLSSVTFADGDIPGGGKTCTQNCFTSNDQPPEPTTEEPTSTEPASTDPNQSTSDDSVLTSVQEYLISIFGEAGSLLNL